MNNIHNFNINLQIYAERGSNLMFYKSHTLATIKDNIDLKEINIDVAIYCSRTEYHTLCKYLLLLNKCVDLYELAVLSQDHNVFNKCMEAVKDTGQYYKSNHAIILTELSKQKQRINSSIIKRGPHLCSYFIKVAANVLVYECYVKNIMFDANWFFKHKKYDHCFISNIY